jgi:hypothetical protein
MTVGMAGVGVVVMVALMVWPVWISGIAFDRDM